MQTFIRHILPANVERPPALGPKRPTHPTVGAPCPACGAAFQPGDYTTLVALGPGDDPEAQGKARAGRWFNAVALELHWTCASGQPNPTGDTSHG